MIFTYGKWVGNTDELSRIYLEVVLDLKSVPKSHIWVSKLDFSTRESGNTEGPTTLRSCEPGNIGKGTILRTCDPGNTEKHISLVTCEPGNTGYPRLPISCWKIQVPQPPPRTAPRAGRAGGRDGREGREGRAGRTAASGGRVGRMGRAARTGRTEPT